MHILPFRIENIWLAIDASQVEQILGKREWTRVPGAWAQWPGVLGWHGSAVAVLDLGLLLDFSPLSPILARRRTLIAKAIGSLLAIAVDEIREAQVVAENLLRPARITRQPFAAYELELESSVVPVIDPIALVADALARGTVPPNKSANPAGIP